MIHPGIMNSRIKAFFMNELLMEILSPCVVFVLMVAVIGVALSDDCRTIEFIPDTAGKYLLNHVIKSLTVQNKGICEISCYRDPDCVSYNYGPIQSVAPSCQLNNRTHLQVSSDDFVTRNGYTYREILNSCQNSPCPNYAACQAGFTSKGYRCVCPQGYIGEHCESAIKDCSQVPTPRKTGVYYIRSHGSEPFPVYCDHTSDGGGWTMVFKVVGGVSSLAGDQLWTSSDIVSENVAEALDITSKYKGNYKNRIVQSWQTFNPQEARVVLYTNGTEVASIKFNARGTNNLDWFSQNNLVQSPWTDLKTATNLNNFGINGAASKRNFEISANYGGCHKDAGWLVITGRYCQWETRQPKPGILYSKKTLKITWNVQADVGVAEVMIVYIR